MNLSQEEMDLAIFGYDGGGKYHFADVEDGLGGDIENAPSCDDCSMPMAECECAK